MRTKSFIPLLGFMLLLMAVSCTDPIEVNPNYDPETKEVVTNLVFSVNLPGQAQTKQSGEAVQENTTSSFWGITKGSLLTYKRVGDGQILSKDSTANKAYDLGDVAAAGVLSRENSKRVIELSLPLQTNTLLFYGRGMQPNAQVYGTGTSFEDCYGKLDDYSVTNEAGSANFQLGRRLKVSEETKFEVTEKLLAGILSLIMNTQLLDGGLYGTEVGGQAPTIYKNIVSTEYPGITSDTDPLAPYGYNVTTDEYSNFKWSDYGQAYTNKTSLVGTGEITPLESKLGRAYNQMTTINSAGGELRAASGEALLRTITDLWTVINEVRCAQPMNKAEAVAKYFAYIVHRRLQFYFSATSIPNSGAAVTGVVFNTFESIRAAFNNNLEIAFRPYAPNNGDLWPSDGEIASIITYSLAEFPFNFNLPRGATHMAFMKREAETEYNYFYYPSSFNTSGMGGVSEGGSFNAKSYYYPAELMYFGNSPIRASDTEHTKNQYPNTVSDWLNDASWASAWTDSHVKSSTRSVAMKYDIRYGVALLQTKVKYGAPVLKDNNHAIQAALDQTITDEQEPDKLITVNDDSFKLTGVIIGGQPVNVGWDNLSIANSSTNKKEKGFIYDKAIPTNAQNIKAESGSVSPNYTVVFDNFVGEYDPNNIYVPGIVTAAGASTPDPRAGQQEIVYVALEFLNNTNQDFYGNYNLIRAGGYFYLIGALAPESAKNISEGKKMTWPDKGFIVPPYTADGLSQEVERVFIQSFVTEATFVLGENSLKHAYLTVPDLRAGSMNLGLTVNLDWSTGLKFENVILGEE